MISRDVVIKAESQAAYAGSKLTNVCEWAPDAIEFFRQLIDALPWQAVWMKVLAKGAVTLLEKLMEARCPTD